MLKLILGLVLFQIYFTQTVMAQTSAVSPTGAPTSGAPASTSPVSPTTTTTQNGVAAGAANPTSSIPNSAPNAQAGLTTTPAANNQVVEIDPVTGKPVVRSAGNQKYRFGGYLVGSLESTTNPEDTQYTRSGSIFALANVTHVPSSFQARATLARQQNFTYADVDGSTGAWADPSFAIGRPFQVSGLNTFLVRVVGSMPLSRQSQLQKFAGSTGLSVVLGKVWSRFSITQVFNYTRRYFYFEIDRSGRVNSPDSLLSSTTFNYQFTDRLSVSLNGTYNYLVSYQNVGRTTTEFSISGSYSLTDRFSLNSTVNTSSGLLDSAGQRYQFNGFDRRNVTASVGAAYSM